MGVVDNPRSITSNPKLTNVDVTNCCTMSPDGRASLPTTTAGFDFNLDERFIIHSEYPAVNFTMSTGVNPSPGFPPMVPLIPEIDLINVTVKNLGGKYMFTVCPD